jgi:hypothetical protein
MTTPETAGLTDAHIQGVQLVNGSKRKRKRNPDDEDFDENDDRAAKKEMVLAMLMGSETEGRANIYWDALQLQRHLLRETIFHSAIPSSTPDASDNVNPFESSDPLDPSNPSTYVTAASLQSWLLLTSPGTYWPPWVQPVNAKLVSDQLVLHGCDKDDSAPLVVIQPKHLVEISAALNDAFENEVSAQSQAPAPTPAPASQNKNKNKNENEKKCAIYTYTASQQQVEASKNAWTAAMQLAALVRLRAPDRAATVWTTALQKSALARGKTWQEWLSAMVEQSAQGHRGAYEAQVMAQAVAALDRADDFSSSVGRSAVVQFCLSQAAVMHAKSRKQDENKWHSMASRIWWTLGVRLLLLNRVFDLAPLDHLEGTSADYLMRQCQSLNPDD